MKNSVRNNRLPRPPKALSPAARKLWRGLLSEFNITDAAGLAILTAGLESYDRAAKAKDLLDKEGAVVVDRFGQQRVHPAVNIERDSRAAYLMALKQLNLDLEPTRPVPGRPGSGMVP